MSSGPRQRLEARAPDAVNRREAADGADTVGTDDQARGQAVRVERIAAHDLVLVRVKDRLIYGQVLAISDGTVRFRPLCPAAGWHSATARQVIGHWRKTGRHGHAGPALQTAPASSAQQLQLPEADT